MQILRKKRLATALLSAAWLLALAGGLNALMRYENAPGDAGVPPQQWPAESLIQREKGIATLIVLAHPRCPCTQASVSELAQIMADAQGSAKAYVLFTQPANSSETSAKTGLWKTAAAIPGVTVLADIDGGEARRFHIETSGHALLFDPAGSLLFSGGITASRGHEGNNAGESAIVSLLKTGAADRNRTLVFGCPLFNAKSETALTVCSK